MKKFLSGVIAGTILAGSIGFAAQYIADTATFKVMVNGKEFVSDKPVVAIEGSTYLPLKAIGEVLGVPVQWNQELMQVEVGETETQNSLSAFDAFENKLASLNIKYEKIEMAAIMIGAEEGYKYKTDNGNIELYVFDAESEAFKKVKETNKVTLEGFGSIDAFVNGNVVLIIDDIEEKEEVLSLFNSL